ncbi:hypothetical protein [Brevibacillus parabrevis]|uniref:hypothetical protein n=1 Tax=Brevibacillus parabrevis TaxID=54914 RepID=UPI0035A35ECC
MPATSKPTSSCGALTYSILTSLVGSRLFFFQQVAEDEIGHIAFKRNVNGLPAQAVPTDCLTVGADHIEDAPDQRIDQLDIHSPVVQIGADISRYGGYFGLAAADSGAQLIRCFPRLVLNVFGERAERFVLDHFIDRRRERDSHWCLNGQMLAFLHLLRARRLRSRGWLLLLSGWLLA